MSLAKLIMSLGMLGQLSLNAGGASSRAQAPPQPDATDATVPVARTPSRDRQWVTGRWVCQDARYRWIAGRWQRASEDLPRDPPPRARPEYPKPREGWTWIPGVYQWRHGRYRWADGYWAATRAGQQWQPGQWAKAGDRFQWAPGRWREQVPRDGVLARRPAERERERG